LDYLGHKLDFKILVVVFDALQRVDSVIAKDDSQFIDSLFGVHYHSVDGFYRSFKDNMLLPLVEDDIICADDVVVSHHHLREE